MWTRRPGCMARVAKLKTIAVRLTPAGLDETWRLIGRSRDEALIMTRTIAQLAPGAQWVRETRLNEGRGWGDGCHGELKLVQVQLRPALVLGWIDPRATRGASPVRRRRLAAIPAESATTVRRPKAFGSES
jgi:hypothetical protein